MFNVNIKEYVNESTKQIDSPLLFKKIEVMEGLINNILKNNFESDYNNIFYTYTEQYNILNNKLIKLMKQLNNKQNNFGKIEIKPYRPPSELKPEKKLKLKKHRSMDCMYTYNMNN